MKHVRERLLSLRLMEHIQKQPDLADRLAISVTVSGKPATERKTNRKLPQEKSFGSSQF